MILLMQCNNAINYEFRSSDSDRFSRINVIITMNSMARFPGGPKAEKIKSKKIMPAALKCRGTVRGNICHLTDWFPFSGRELVQKLADDSSDRNFTDTNSQ